MFWEAVALSYLVCSMGGLFLNWKMHKRFLAGDALKKQNEELLHINRDLMKALRDAKKT